MPRRAVELASEIRRLFTIHFLDPRAVHIQVTPPRAVITGEVRRLPGYSAPVMPQTLAHLEAELAQIRELRFVRWSLDNWANDGGEWRPVKEREVGL